MKTFVVLLLFCLSRSSFGSKISFSEFAKGKDAFSLDKFQKFYETLESIRSPISSKNRASPDLLDSSVVVNEYIDTLMVEVQSYLKENDLHSVDLEDIEESFSYTLLWITYHGSLSLTAGQCVNLDSVKRTGDVVASYSNKYLTIDVPLGFEDLNVNYDYEAEIMDIGPSGSVNGITETATFTFTMGLNFTKQEIELIDFIVDDIGDISLDFSGNSLFDWLLEIISDIILPLFKSNLTGVIENNVNSIVQELVNVLNENLQEILS